ncbi:Arginyl-tRNA synthetase [Giardia muris]|uniref:arginine--tRNA ligase n=1 Tax=Giardia muris TaxID=5742 RepID=A0A4Z1T5P1_GIAMU|nr:Arginyl-tRNA synthetase [Giardia muris]|eukprot:TNJ29373.1 Arginyl-tRNA synthetase [Giardia muris]
MDDLRLIMGAALGHVCGPHLPALRETVAWEEKMLNALTVPQVMPTSNLKFGHYQFNNVMGISKALKKLGYNLLTSDPTELAQLLVNAAKAHPKTTGVVQDFNVVLPMINIVLLPAYLVRKCWEIYLDVPSGGLPHPPSIPTQTVLVDFSSPNIAKSMHVGHLRSTIIGDTLARLYEYVGYTVHRINHLGDWGTQFGMLIAFLLEKYPTIGSSLRIPQLPIDDLVAFYKEARVRFDNDPEFQAKAHEEVVRLQSLKSPEFLLWHRICDLSRVEFQAIYDRLDIRLKDMGESFYRFKLNSIVCQLRQKKMLVESDGALVIEVPDVPYPLIIVKSDGGYTYDTTDMATIYHRAIKMGVDKIVYVVDAGQATHFELVFKAAIRAGWITPDQALFVPFGVVLGEDGKRLKTRSGETLKLVDLLDEAVIRAREQLLEKEKENPGAVPLTEEEIKTISEAIGYGAVKYADLSSQRIKDYRFSYDKMLSLKGNTAAYLLYSFTRISSICRKASVAREALYEHPEFKPPALEYSHPAEIALLTTLLKLHDVILFTLEDLMPHRICDWVYSLAAGYTDFYEKCRVIETDEEGQSRYNPSRLALCEMTRQGLRIAFSLLGIRELERM